MSTSDDELLERLRETGETLPYELRRQILDVRSDRLVSGLIEIAGDDSLRSEDRETYSPPVHAALMLGLMGAESATGVLVESVREEGDATALGTVAGRALQNMGPDAGLPAVLEAYEETDDPLERRRLARVLGGFEGEHPRVVEVLGRELREQPADVQHEILLAIERYGAVAGVSEIRSWFEAESLDPEEPGERFVIEISAKVVRSLGGELGEHHRELLERARGVDAPE